MATDRDSPHRLRREIHGVCDAWGAPVTTGTKASARTGRSVLVVAGGTVVAQAIGAAATPLLTRLYGPEALGLLAAVVAYAGVVGPVAGACLPVAIVLASDQGQVGDLARAARRIAAPVAAAAALAAPIFLGRVLEAGVAWTTVAFAVLLLVASSVWTQISQQKILRAQDFSLLSLLTLGQAAIFALAQVGTGLIKADPVVLIVVSSTYSVIFLVIALLVPRYRRLSTVPPRRAPLRAVLRRFQDFPRYRAPQVLVNTLGLHLPTLLLVAFADIRWAGLFMVTQRILALPVTLVGKSISDVIYPQVVTLTRDGRSAYPLVTRWTIIAMAVAAPVAGAVLSLGEPAFAFVLGAEWGEAGLLAKSLLPWMVVALLSRPAIGAVPALGLQRAYLVSEAVVTTVKSAVLWIMLVMGMEVWLCLLAWSVIGACGGGWITVAVCIRARQGHPIRFTRTGGSMSTRRKRRR